MIGRDKVSGECRLREHSPIGEHVHDRSWVAFPATLARFGNRRVHGVVLALPPVIVRYFTVGGMSRRSSRLISVNCSASSLSLGGCEHIKQLLLHLSVMKSVLWTDSGR